MNIRQYKKKYAICVDDTGKMIYRGDIVRVWLPMETNTYHLSRVYFNMLDGAYIHSSPTHSFLNDGNPSNRNLRDYLNQTPIPIHTFGEETTELKKGFCIKVKSFNK
jgi:hypothetical protein